jgi:hypothetical protein
MKKKRTFARVDATCMLLSVMLLIVTKVCLPTVMADAVPESHQNLVKADSESEEMLTQAVGSKKAACQLIQRKCTRLKVHTTLMHSTKEFLYGKLKQNHCKRSQELHAAAPRNWSHALHTAALLPSSVPIWLHVKLRQRKDKSAFANATINSATFSNATSGAASNASRVADVNVSTPDDGRAEETRPSSNPDKARLDPLGRLEEEQPQQLQQQQQQQQQQLQQSSHGSANRSSSIPLIHRSNDETLTKGVNYASAALGAKIVSSNVEGKHASALLLDEEERYWMSPCSANRSVVIELAESVLVKSITLMHNEYYSSISRAVLLQGAQVMPTDR